MQNSNTANTAHSKNCGYQYKFAMVGHFLFFGSIFFLFNPFLEIETVPRFAGFGLMVTAGVLFSIIAYPIFEKRMFFWLISFSILYAISIVRINYIGLNSKLEQDSSVIEATLTMLVVSSSMLMTNPLKINLMRKTLIIIGVPTSIWITLNYNALFDYSLKDSFKLGNVDYNSYQIVSQFLAITTISCISLINVKKIISGRNFILISLSIIFLFGMSQGLARGEYVALIIAISVLIFGSKLAIFVISGIYISLPIIFSVVDLPIVDRLLEVEQGDYGTRDYLFRAGYEALISDPVVLFVGGGLNYFQDLMNLPLESFPHNIFLESWISGGLVFFIIMVSIYVTPLIKAALLSRVNQDQKFLLAICLFCTIIGMKSGTIVSPWLIGLFSCCFLRLKFSTVAWGQGYQESGASLLVGPSNKQSVPGVKF